jgi:hypothetical protein
MPDGLLLTAATGRGNFSISIRNRDEIAFDEEKFNPENEGRLLAEILYQTIPWATLRAMVVRVAELEGMEE